MVAPQVSGFIQEVLAEDNQSVAAGQLLARIDDREYVAALAAARADLAVASAQLVNANATLERHQAVISQALAVTRADAADLRFAESEVQRHRNLASEGAGTRQAYEQARSRLDMTQARQAEQSHPPGHAQAAGRAGRAARGGPGRRAARAGAGRPRRTQPVPHPHHFAGRRRGRTPRAARGRLRRPGTPILAVVPLQQAYVVANFREKQLTHMRPGQPATVTVDAYPDLRLRGTVQSIAPATGLSLSPVAPSNATGNFTKIAQRLPVKIVLDATPAGAPPLRAGMSVEAVVETMPLLAEAAK